MYVCGKDRSLLQYEPIYHPHYTLYLYLWVLVLRPTQTETTHKQIVNVNVVNSGTTSDERTIYVSSYIPKYIPKCREKNCATAYAYNRRRNRKKNYRDDVCFQLVPIFSVLTHPSCSCYQCMCIATQQQLSMHPPSTAIVSASVVTELCQWNNRQTTGTNSECSGKTSTKCHANADKDDGRSQNINCKWLMALYIVMILFDGALTRPSFTNFVLHIHRVCWDVVIN